MANDMDRFILQWLQQSRNHRTHEDLCSALKDEGCLKIPEVVQAFEKVDRKHFLTESLHDEAYLNMPLREGSLHQSAPSVYANALEALELTKAGLSFLNIGSGTGYFSALVAQMIGPNAIHIGVERHEDLVDHARKKCADMGLNSIQFVCGNGYLLDIDGSIRFDRIYVGAGAYRDARSLFKLLKIGGIIVGPFQDEDSESQTLIKARRVNIGTFAVSDRTPVQFAWLVRPSDEEERHGKTRLKGPEWGSSTLAVFPPRFKKVALHLYWMSTYVRDSLPYSLTWEIWVRQILPWLAIDSFDTDAPAESAYASKCAACGATGAKSACGRCKAVRYCNRACQQQHWSSHKGECCNTSKANVRDSPESMGAAR